jgi:hypothetical protein
MKSRHDSGKDLACLRQEKEAATTMDEEQAKQEVLKFTDALRDAGIGSVCVSYSGCGDEGQTEAPQCEGAQGDPLELRSLRKIFDLDRLGELLANFVPEGYEDGEGGWGTITFDVQSGKIRVEHNWYETVSHAVDPREI